MEAAQSSDGCHQASVPVYNQCEEKIHNLNHSAKQKLSGSPKGRLSIQCRKFNFVRTIRGICNLNQFANEYSRSSPQLQVLLPGWKLQKAYEFSQFDFLILDRYCTYTFYFIDLTQPIYRMKSLLEIFNKVSIVELKFWTVQNLYF